VQTPFGQAGLTHTHDPALVVGILVGDDHLAVVNRARALFVVAAQLARADALHRVVAAQVETESKV
jgi:hypothetical protein